jgi:hypothetical protein
MDQLREFTQQNSSMISSVLFIGLACLILYVVYTYLYPADDPSYVQFLQREVDSRKGPIALKHGGKTPAIFTGGDFTLSFWIYVDDWNYQVAKYKPVFNIGPAIGVGNDRSVLVGMLTPYKNGLMIRGATNSPPTAVPDITVTSIRTSMLNGQTSASMFQNTVESSCDVSDVPLQRWSCVTIVSSGRTLDVYMNGKLARSCILDSILQVPNAACFLSLGAFGGRYASVQMWNQQLTPDVIYGIYMMGPSQAQHNIITDISKFLGLNVTFSGSTPGQVNSFAQDPFAAISSSLNANLPGACEAVANTNWMSGV